MSKEQIEEMMKHCPFYEKGKCILLEEKEVECDMKCDLCDFAKSLYNAGYRKQSEWISVDERLPERTGKYLVFTYNRRLYIGDFVDHYCDGNQQFDDYKVTHWMPLPEPPKMKGGAE